MSKERADCWFLASRGKGGLVDYVIRAEDLCKAEASMGGLADGYDFERLDWDRLQVLTGCMIPSRQEPCDLASGDLLFDCVGRVICIRYVS